MKRKITTLVALTMILGLFCTACNQDNTFKKISIPQNAKPLPKALFITTGINFKHQDPALPSAIVIAIQELSKNGIPVKLSDRDILYEKEKLMKYQILILLTAQDIHDADREFSLTYMTDAELNNIKEFVRKGGFLISGDNVGRNTYEGDDRMLQEGELNPDNFPLADVYGMILKEMNMKDYEIVGTKQAFEGEKKAGYENDIWLPTGVQIISDKLDTLAIWRKGIITYPAITRNNYGRGRSYLIGLSDWLTPANNGGEAGVSQIEKFYEYVAYDYYHYNALPVQQNLWPNGYDAAFAVSFNIADTLTSYKFVMEKLQSQHINPTFFVSGIIKSDIKKYLKKTNATLASSGYLYADYTVFDFADATQDILQNEAGWQIKFKGFRFPFTTPSYEGMLALKKNNYAYDSSIGANNIDFIHGSVVPYNLVLAGDDYYQATDMFEIAPTYHDDYFFIGKLKTNEYKTPRQLENDILRYRQYLQDYWNYAVKPNKGLMLVLAHPDLTGYSENTFSALQNIIDTVKTQNVWITDLPNIVDYFKNIDNVTLFVENNETLVRIFVKTENDAQIKNYSLKLNFKPATVNSTIGSSKIKHINNEYFLIFDAIENQAITIAK